MKIPLMILGLVLMILPIVIINIGSDSQQVIAPCVDGDGDINLEGIMCDKQVVTLFGDEGLAQFSIIFLLLSLLGFVSLLFGEVID